MIERDVEQALKRGIEANVPGAKCLKFVSPGYIGVPDRIVLLPGGRVVFVELKRPNERPRQRQLFVQSRLRKLGFTVYGCVDSMEKVNRVVWHCQLIAAAVSGGGGGVATRKEEVGDGGSGV